MDACVLPCITLQESRTLQQVCPLPRPTLPAYFCPASSAHSFHQPSWPHCIISPH
ncbi:hypothetical protein OG21DRAFT_565694 [Imleria badia]|nr:hypothetical protein OG21DRAFT_565694 [Imleria badia]